MKNKQKKNYLLKDTFINFIIRILLWTVILPLILFITAEVISRLDFQWLYNISEEKYNNAISIFDSVFNSTNIIIIFGVIWGIGNLILIYNLLKNVFYYINSVTEASKQLVDKNVDFIELPPELEEIQKSLNHLKRESEKNERLAKENEQRKNDLVVYLAHDLKTPLTSMIGYLSILDEIKDMPKKQAEKYIKIALDKSYKLEDLINELFEITRFNSETILINKDEINLNLMFEQIIDDFYPILKDNEKKINFKSDEKILIEGDSNRLARVFDNLIKNAINYSISSDINIEVNKLENNVQIIISNKAKKIPEEKLQRIFEKFYRADSARNSKTGGTGLGLAISKEIIELHNGKIYVTSDNEYMKFFIELPIK